MHTSDARMLRGAAIPTSVVGVGAVLIGLLAAGAKGALAAALATVVVIAFFSVSALAVSWAGKISAQTMMMAALASYVVKILVMMVLVTLVAEVTIWNTKVFGWTVIALAMLWIAAEFRVALQRRPYIDEPRADAPKETESDDRAHQAGESRADDAAEPRNVLDRSP